ncbi:hypothetical protein OL229_16145 [Neisseriaceae bacterium JH1-16]|nr:hypothetical protein [Neisseriaceae bacterium JH1-16]
MTIVGEIPDRVKRLATSLVAACEHGAGQHEVEAFVKSVLVDLPDLSDRERLATYLHLLSTDSKAERAQGVRDALQHAKERVISPD